MIRFFLLTLLSLTVAAAIAAQQPAAKPNPIPPPAKATRLLPQSPGERAFNANCSRCHNAPEQLAPRITGTVMMHMRVRANLSAADEKVILHYLAP